MGLAMHLGVDDLESPRMRAARGSWTRWCADDPALAVVDTLTELSEWTRHARGAEKETVLASLAGLTAYDCDAAVALAWLLLPGATRVAAELSDLHPDIDGLVAGQLWIEVSGAHRLRSPMVGLVKRATGLAEELLSWHLIGRLCPSEPLGRRRLCRRGPESVAVFFGF